MFRRKFLQNTLSVGLGAFVLNKGYASKFNLGNPDNLAPAKFKLKYAPHIGMFEKHAGSAVLDQLEFIASSGFTAFEDNEMRLRSIQEQKAMAQVMQRRGLEMGVFVGHTIYWEKPSLTSGEESYINQFLEEIKASVEIAKRVNAKWITVVPGCVDLKLSMGYQTVNVVETLKKAAAILEPHKLVMVLEPLNFRDHPGLFLQKSSQAYQICKTVASPSCKILFDIYHQQISEGNLIPNITKCWDEIAYFQIGDNPGRNEPTTGEINYKNIFKYIFEKGYEGILGMEHGNSKKDKAGEEEVINAYKEVDNF